MTRVFKMHRAGAARAGVTPLGQGPVGQGPVGQGHVSRQASGQARRGAPGKNAAPVKEIGGPAGPEPTRYGDWERNGICYDF